MSFMKLEAFLGNYYEVETAGGTNIVPLEVSGFVETNWDLSDYLDGPPREPDAEPELKTGWVARLTAPGFLDCTDWSAFPEDYTEDMVREEMNEMYGLDEEEDE